jgi:hypothetical protein
MGTLIFYSDDKYTYSQLDGTDKINKTYKLDPTSCQIILREKRRKDEQSNIEIIYVDRKYLIYKEDNIHGDILHIYLSECKRQQRKQQTNKQNARNERTTRTNKAPRQACD